MSYELRSAKWKTCTNGPRVTDCRKSLVLGYQKCLVWRHKTCLPGDTRHVLSGDTRLSQEMSHPLDAHLWVTPLTQNPWFFDLFFICLESLWECWRHILASFWHPPGNVLGSIFHGFFIDLGPLWEQRGIKIHDFCGSRFPKGEFLWKPIFWVFVQN